MGSYEGINFCMMPSMWDIPDHRNPVAHLPWRFDTAMYVGQILVTVLENAKRSLLLRNTARQFGAPYLVCEQMRSARRFLEFLARGLRLRVPRDRYQLWDALAERLQREPQLVVLDNAELLTRTSLEIIRDFHKMARHNGCQVAFVLGSSEQRLLKHIEAIDCEGSFVGHCSYYIPGCEPTPRMRERAERLDEALAPPTLPFRAASATARDYPDPHGEA